MVPHFRERYLAGHPAGGLVAYPDGLEVLVDLVGNHLVACFKMPILRRRLRS